MTQGKIFFSYSRKDTEFVLKLAKDLRDAGIDLWLDQLDIEPGTHWDNSIENALNAAPTMLFIMSPDSVVSHNVMDEVSYALEGGKRVIPVLHKTCNVPFRLRRVQFLDFTRDYNIAFSHLLEAIGKVGLGGTLYNQPPDSDANNNAHGAEKAQNEKAEWNENLEELIWEKAKTRNTVTAIQGYLEEYPNGEHAQSARELLSKLNNSGNGVSSKPEGPILSDPEVINIKVKKKTAQKFVLLTVFFLGILIGAMAAVSPDFRHALVQLFSGKNPVETEIASVAKPEVPILPEIPKPIDSNHTEEKQIDTNIVVPTVTENNIILPLKGAYKIAGLTGPVTVELEEGNVQKSMSQITHWNLTEFGSGYYIISTQKFGATKYLMCDINTLHARLQNSPQLAQYWKIQKDPKDNNKFTLKWMDDWALNLGNAAVMFTNTGVRAKNISSFTISKY